MKRTTLVLVALALLAATAVAARPAEASGNPNPGILPVGSNPYGQAYGEWSGAWWRWALSFPWGTGPVWDTTGEQAAEGQSGPVWFLAGTYGGSAERTVTVPTGKALFFPIYNIFWLNVPELGDAPWSDEQDAFASDLLAGMVDPVTDVACEIDGVPVEDLTSYRAQTPDDGEYMLTLPDENLFNVYGLGGGTYGPTVDDGIYLMLAPLPKGEHTIHFTAGDFLDVTYHLTVEK